MSENTKQKNTKKIKQDSVFVASYFIVIAGLVLSVCCKFLNTGTSNIGIFDIINFSGALRSTAILAIILFSAMVVTAVICLVERFASFGKQTEKQNKLGLILVLANIVLLVVCFPSLISAEIHLLRYYKGATIGFAFVTNLLLPLAFVALLICDKKQFVKNEFGFDVSKQKLGATAFVYPVLALIALVVFCLPVYKYRLADGTSGFYTEMLSLYGATVHTSLLNHRAALLLISSALVSLAMFAVQLGIANAQSKSDWAKEKMYKNCRIVIAVVMLVVAIYCLPSVLNFMTECKQYLEGLAEGVYTDVTFGISYYSMLAVSMLIVIFCSIDGINEYLAKPVDKKKRAKETTVWQISRSIFKAGYITVLLIILLAISLPYAKYGLWDVENLDFFSYITLYSGVDKGYVDGMPATNTLFVYALLTAILAGVSLVVMYVGQKAPSKRKTLVCTIIKTVCMIVFICVFAWLNASISFYYSKFAELAQMSGSYLAMGIAGNLLSVATIGYLAIVCLDVIIYGTKFLQSRK